MRQHRLLGLALSVNEALTGFTDEVFNEQDMLEILEAVKKRNPIKKKK